MRINYGNGNELTSNDDLNVQQFVNKNLGLFTGNNASRKHWFVELDAVARMI